MEQTKNPELPERQPYNPALQEYPQTVEVIASSTDGRALTEEGSRAFSPNPMPASPESAHESSGYIGLEDLRKFGEQYNYMKSLPGRIWQSLLRTHNYQISLLELKLVNVSEVSDEPKYVYQLELDSLARLLDHMAAELPKYRGNRYYYSTILGPGSGRVTYEFLCAFVKERLNDQPDQYSD